jgi:SepF-like predicted cell division protein (DUF552 family)
MERLTIHHKNGTYEEISDVSNYIISGNYLLVETKKVPQTEEPMINKINTIYPLSEIKYFSATIKTAKYNLND